MVERNLPSSVLRAIPMSRWLVLAAAATLCVAACGGSGPSSQLPAAEPCGQLEVVLEDFETVDDAFASGAESAILMAQADLRASLDELDALVQREGIDQSVEDSAHRFVLAARSGNYLDTTFEYDYDDEFMDLCGK